MPTWLEEFSTDDAQQLASDPIEELLDGGVGIGNVEALQSCFPHEFDTFQRLSLEHLLDGKSVLVCAPTGAGKTLIAEAAIVAALAAGKRVLYTTPLKVTHAPVKLCPSVWLRWLCFLPTVAWLCMKPQLSPPTQ